MMRFFKLASVLVAAAAISACTSSGEKGNPTTPSPTSAGSTGTGSSNGLPARPANLKVDSVDACKLLTESQMKQIDLLVTTPKQLDLVEGQKSPGCQYRGNGGYAYTVGAVTHKGVSYWLEGDGNVDAKATKVDDYGAVEIQLKGGTGFDCSVSVDVAEGQQLMVSYIPTSNSETDQAALCGKAQKAAGFALATLKTLK